MIESQQVDVCADADAAAQAVARALIAQIRAKPASVLGLATGATMEPVYRLLVESFRRGELSFAQVATFNLDEYIGLLPESPHSYRATMQRLLFDHVDIARHNTYLPNGMADNPVREAAYYEGLIEKAGGIDMQLLGIGRNGHIGFNEPGSDFHGRTHVVDLHPSTLAANARFFGGETPPHQAITMGIATILAARRIIVLATGAVKQPAVKRALAPPPDETCPASALQRHSAVSWWLDAAAYGS